MGKILALFLVIGGLLGSPVDAASYHNRATANLCLAISYTSAVGWDCASGYSQVTHTQGGALKGYNGACLTANSSSSVMWSSCKSPLPSNQRWTFAAPGLGGAIYGHLYAAWPGNGRFLWLTSNARGAPVGLTTTYPNDNKRFWD